MFRSKKRLAAMFLLAGMLSSSALAGELSDGKKDRRGFFLGLGAGVGWNYLRGGGASFNDIAVLTDIKVGGGLSENLLLLYNGSLRYAKISGVNFSVYNFPVALQWFFHDDFYMRPGIGLSVSNASISTGRVTVSATSRISWGFDLAAGREFRIGNRFTIGPEATYQYSHVRVAGPNGNDHTFGAKASLLWYF